MLGQATDPNGSAMTYNATATDTKIDKFIDISDQFPFHLFSPLILTFKSVRTQYVVKLQRLTKAL